MAIGVHSSASLAPAAPHHGAETKLQTRSGTEFPWWPPTYGSVFGAPKVPTNYKHFHGRISRSKLTRHINFYCNGVVYLDFCCLRYRVAWASWASRLARNAKRRTAMVKWISQPIFRCRWWWGRTSICSEQIHFMWKWIFIIPIREINLCIWRNRKLGRWCSTKIRRERREEPFHFDSAEMCRSLQCNLECLIEIQMPLINDVGLPLLVVLLFPRLPAAKHRNYRPHSALIQSIHCKYL